MSSLSRRRLLASTALVMAAPAIVRAQAWPTKQIRMIAPYPPGGGVDTVSRAFSEKMSPKLGQTIVVDNQPGAGGTIGAAALARSPADGHTLMIGSMVDYSIAPYFHQNLSFDMAKDFVPILEIGNGTIGVLVTPSLPVKNVQELIALAKSKPGQLSYASSGYRRPDPSQLRDAEADDGRGDDPRALQGHQLLPGRPLRESRAGLDRQRAGPPAAPRGRQGALPRRHQQDALAARCPTCRPWPRRACRASNRPPTTRCSRPRRCRPTSSRS